MVQIHCDIPDRFDIATLIGYRGPCLSLGMVTHRVGQEAYKDRIRLRNLLRLGDRELDELGVPERIRRTIIEPAEKLEAQNNFWRFQEDFLILYLTPDRAYQYRLPIAFPEFRIPSHRLYLTPILDLDLLRQEFYLLALSQSNTQLYQCSRDSIKAVDIPGLPNSLKQSLQFLQEQRQLQWHTGVSNRGASKRSAIFHGHGVSAKEFHRERVVEFLRQLDDILTPYLVVQRKPLMLACVEKLFPLFKGTTSYRNIFGQFIRGNPEVLSSTELWQKSWTIANEWFSQRHADHIEMLREHRGHRTVESAPIKAILAASHGQVEELFVKPGVHLWGRFKPDDQSIEVHRVRQCGDDELVDLAAVYTFEKGGVVHSIGESSAAVLTEPMAAVLRYPGGGVEKFAV